jgi:hypothetical protein
MHLDEKSFNYLSELVIKTWALKCRPKKTAAGNKTCQKELLPLI